MTNGMVNPRTWALLELLADGEFHSGQVLANRLGLSRASVFNALSDVAACGIVLQRIRGRGYKLARPWQRLERDEIMCRLGKDAGLYDIEILSQAASSNTLLLQRAGGAAFPQSAGFAITSDLASVVSSPSRMASSPISNVSEAEIENRAQSGSVLAVELQTGGRGRMGRAWHSSLGTALTFSLLWRFDCGLNDLSGLSLAVGVAIVRALNKLGAQGVKLKWPNDILTELGKLAGVLIEVQGDMFGPSAVVIGIGLNCSLPASLVPRIGQPASALDEVCAAMPTRNQLLAELLIELARVLQQFAKNGFAGLRDEWERYHFHQNKQVRLQFGDGQTVNGIVRGVGDKGELCLETAQGMRRFNSGEVGVQRQ